MTEKQIRAALRANYGWSKERFDMVFANHEGEFTDQDYISAIQDYPSSKGYPTNGYFNISHGSNAGLAEDNKVNYWDEDEFA